MDYEKKKKEAEQYGRFLKMIDDLQTPKHKTNHKYRRVLPLSIKENNKEAKKFNC